MKLVVDIKEFSGLLVCLMSCDFMKKLWYRFIRFAKGKIIECCSVGKNVQKELELVEVRVFWKHSMSGDEGAVND